MNLLYNVTAFMRPGQPIEVRAKNSNRSGAEVSVWPLTIKIGPGGEDTIDIHTNIENATRLRDALTAALEQPTKTVADFRCTEHGKRGCDQH